MHRKTVLDYGVKPVSNSKDNYRKGILLVTQ